MKTLELFRLLPRKTALTIISLVTVQQFLTAASTWALGEAGLHVAQGSGFLIYIVLFLVLTLLPQAFNVGIQKIETEGYWQAYRNFLDDRLFRHARKAELWQNHDRKEVFQTAIGPDADSYLTAVLFSILDIYKFGLTIVLNIAALALVVDGLFPWAYAVAGGVSVALFQVLARYIDSKILEEQAVKIAFFSYLLKCWDNVFLNNATVEKNYRTSLLDQHASAGKSLGRSRVAVELSTLILTIASHLPIFALIVYLAVRDQGDVAALTALLVTIPRQMYVLATFKSFFEQINSLVSFKARIQSAYANSELEMAPRGRIQAPKIQMNGIPLTSAAEAVSLVAGSAPGRKIITGSNGAGKSTLLLKLNAEIENSFYMPASPNLEIGVPLGVESTGQRIMKHLDAAIASGAKYLLLDEWDANLDAENRAQIQARLDVLSLDRVIVEIRHH